MTHKLSTALALVLALGAPVAMAQDSTSTNGANAGASNQTTTDASASGSSADTNAATSTDGSATTGTTTTTEGAATTVDAPAAHATTDTNASASIDLTVEQQTEIRTVVTEVQAEPIVAADLDFDVTIGVAVPQTVVLKPLPVRVIEIVPDYEGFLFFILDDGRLVIVDPDTLQIVLIINA